MVPFEHPAPRNEEEFRKFMEALDRHLAELGMPVPARQLAAIAKVCRALGENIPISNLRPPRDGCYTGEDLLLRAVAWYDQRYGDAQEVYFGPGRGLVVLRGDHWLIEYPTITGRAGFSAGQKAEDPRVVYQADGTHTLIVADSPEWQDPELRKFDVLDFMPNLPLGLRTALHRGELEGILYVFCRCRLFLHALVMARHYEFIEEARADLDAAVNHVLARPPATGQAKWACLQAVEKSFKSFLHHSGRDVPRSHDLVGLYSILRDAGGPRLDEELIARVQCEASVRYDSELVGAREAARAHFAAVELAATTPLLLRHLYPRPAT